MYVDLLTEQTVQLKTGDSNSRYYYLMLLLQALTVSLLSSLCTAYTASEWKSRTIYQVLTDRFASTTTSTSSKCTVLSKYCGGNYQGLIEKLDYIEGMGFDAIWISPMPTNYANSYHGYHFTDLYSVNSNFGSESDLKSFISACHKRDIWVMLDVVGKLMQGLYSMIILL